MLRSALKVFKKNIWDVFAVTGLVTIGILIGVLATIPPVYNEINISIHKIVAKATSISYSGFDPATFLKSVMDQIMNLDTKNIFGTLTSLIEQNGFYRIFMGALKDANFNEEVLIEMKDIVIKCSDDLVNVIKSQLINLVIYVGISFVIALLASRIVIQLRSTTTKHIGKFFASFFLNLGTVALAYLLIVICILNLSGFLLVLCILLILMAALGLGLLWAVICYKKKETKLFELFTIKNISFLWLSALAVIVASGLIFLITYLINYIAGLAILLPLVIISNIICENIAVDFVHQTLEEKPLKVEKIEEAAK